MVVHHQKVVQEGVEEVAECVEVVAEAVTEVVAVAEEDLQEWVVEEALVAEDQDVVDQCVEDQVVNVVTEDKGHIRCLPFL